MKTRQGFVSNSSTSSFIIIGEKNIPDVLKNKCVDVTKYENIRKVYSKDNSNIFLTPYISDCSDFYSKMFKKKNIVVYSNGSWDGPYNEEDYIEIESMVWIKKEDIQSEETLVGNNIKFFNVDGEQITEMNFTDTVCVKVTYLRDYQLGYEDE